MLLFARYTMLYKSRPSCRFCAIDCNCFSNKYETPQTVRTGSRFCCGFCSSVSSTGWFDFLVGRKPKHRNRQPSVHVFTNR